MTIKIGAFSGHRKIGGWEAPNPVYDYVWKETEKILIELKPDKMISGVALGYDQLGADLCVSLGIPFVAAVPFLGQENVWPKKSQDKYFRLLDKATEIVYICSPGYAAWKMAKRNEYMVDNADVVIACFDGSPGGTSNCINYAERNNKRIIRIDPRLYNESSK